MVTSGVWSWRDSRIPTWREFSSKKFAKQGGDRFYQSCLCIHGGLYCRYFEKSSDPMAAVSFLQTSLASCVNHKDVKEEKDFQLLASQLFATNEDKSHHTLRSDLFDKLVSYFPSSMTQPSGKMIKKYVKFFSFFYCCRKPTGFITTRR